LICWIRLRILAIDPRDVAGRKTNELTLISTLIFDVDQLATIKLTSLEPETIELNRNGIGSWDLLWIK